jgi:hypothetical protein
MIRMFSSPAALLATLVGVFPISAQTIDIRTLAMRAEQMPEVFVKDAKDHVPLQFSSAQPTGVVRALAASPLPLYRRETDADGKQGFVVSQQVKLPDGANGILLLGWIDGDKSRYIAIKDDFAAARFNDWLLVNASTRPVAFRVGDTGKPILLKPGVSTTHRIPVAEGEGATVLAQAPLNGKDKVFYSTYWPVYAGKRSVVLFVDDGPKILVKRISDPLAPAGTGKTPG